METSNNRQVLSVGAGPTGLVAAIEVARRGVPCRIIDRLPMRSQNEIEGAKWLRQSRCKRAPRMLRDDGHRRRCLHRLGTTDKGRRHWRLHEETYRAYRIRSLAKTIRTRPSLPPTSPNGKRPRQPPRVYRPERRHDSALWRWARLSRAAGRIYWFLFLDRDAGVLLPRHLARVA